MLKMCVKKQNLILINLAIAVIIISTFLCLFNEFNKEKSPSKVKACIIVLLRNQDLNSFIKTITNFELNFNQKYQYPYILLNNEDFTLHFKKQIIKYSNSTIEFGLIPSEHWSIPKWIDRQRVKKSLDSIGFSVEYRKMCRFFSGFFFKQNLTLKYDYFMRLDSHVKFPCSITSDPFVQLSNSNKQYGFILANKETRETIPTLWPTIKKWFNKPKFNIYRKGLRFISNDNGQTLSESNCIFYNNFEIGAFSLFRNESYTSYFNYLDKTGGFFYERWVIFLKILNLISNLK